MGSELLVLGGGPLCRLGDRNKRLVSARLPCGSVLFMLKVGRDDVLAHSSRERRGEHGNTSIEADAQARERGGNRVCRECVRFGLFWQEPLS